ncbi:putative Calcium-binding EF-hand family protein [Senna tora]|uniref:Putative Calcium-binding EF-hand family protein n=1 Tax=Senna tora TaxID=362788 RepID=A0A834WQ84_9FABA|nr:putative Calcium-binding EF-hand family protein [Senna tora]
MKRADRDGDGRLSKEELKQAFRQLGSHVTDWRVFRCLRHVDTDKDGLISASEFDALVKYAVSKYQQTRTEKDRTG